MSVMTATLFSIRPYVFVFCEGGTSIVAFSDDAVFRRDLVLCLTHHGSVSSTW